MQSPPRPPYEVAVAGGLTFAGIAKGITAAVMAAVVILAFRKQSRGRYSEFGIREFRI
jgi:hypothetical protein